MASDRIPGPDDLEQVFASVDAQEVLMARDLLTEGGIECFVFDVDASRMLGSTAAVTARLMVYADDAAEARDQLRELGFPAE
jgi:Putative prokaryotic signal transducing protein